MFVGWVVSLQLSRAFVSVLDLVTTYDHLSGDLNNYQLLSIILAAVLLPISLRVKQIILQQGSNQMIIWLELCMLELIWRDKLCILNNSVGFFSNVSDCRSIFTIMIFPVRSSLRLHTGANLQVCFVNDSSSDKDSDAEDSRTETSLDTPLSPVVCTANLLTVYMC